MIKQEAIEIIKKLEYKYLAYGLMFTDFYSYKDEDLSVLKECQVEYPELIIYTDIKKFRLITKV